QTVFFQPSKQSTLNNVISILGGNEVLATRPIVDRPSSTAEMQGFLGKESDSTGHRSDATTVANKPLETVLLLSELESHLAAFHNLLERRTNGGHIDRSRAADFAEGLISSGSVVAPHDLFGISVDYQVGVMACKDELPLFLCGPNLVHHLKDDGVVQVFL